MPNKPAKLRERPRPTRVAVQKALLSWFKYEGRQLPWRSTSDHYSIMVSEVMLQQTQVDRVIPIYRSFLHRFPTFDHLADASTADVIRSWSGMGYNRRALNLQRAAKRVVEQYNGILPDNLTELQDLPGVGEYTAAALSCFALGNQVAVVDTNVRRVLGRIFYGPKGAPNKEISDTAKQVLPKGEAWNWNQALMDLGATTCSSRRPTCPLCPVRSNCRSSKAFMEPNGILAESHAPYKKKREKFEDSTRYYRGRIVAQLRGLSEGDSCSLDILGSGIKPNYTTDDESWLLMLLNGLQHDGLVVLSGNESNVAVALPS